MTIRLITDTRQFEELRDQWNELLSRSASNNVFLTWEWQIAWWQTYGRDGALRLLLVYDDHERLCGIAPLYRSHIYLGPVRFRTLEFIGARHVSSEYLDFIAVAADHAAIVRAMIAHLRQRRDWSLLFGYHTAVESPTMEVLRDPGLGMPWNETQITESLYVKADDWASYHAQLGKLTRRNVRYYRSKADELSATVSDQTTDAVANLPALIELHQKRMRQLGYPGSYASGRFVEFHKRVGELFEKKGWTRLFTLKIGDRIIAANYGFVYNGSFNDYSMGFDPDYSKQSIGFVLFTHMLERCIGEGLTIDFLDPGRYKETWKPERRLKASYVVASSPRAFAAFTHATNARHFVVDAVKRLVPERAALRMATWKDSLVSRFFLIWG